MWLACPGFLARLGVLNHVLIMMRMLIMLTIMLIMLMSMLSLLMMMLIMLTTKLNNMMLRTMYLIVPCVKYSHASNNKTQCTGGGISIASEREQQGYTSRSTTTLELYTKRSTTTLELFELYCKPHIIQRALEQ